VRKEGWVISVLIITLLMAAAFDVPPFRNLTDWRTTRKAQARYEVTFGQYQLYDYSGKGKPFITIDFLRGEHFWNPQLVFWVEDTLGNYLSTLLVTTSTAKGLFYSGRSVDNFKEFDGSKQVERSTPVRRVNALPHWAHQRGVQAKDGNFAPHPDDPLPDAISGATPTGNFYFQSEHMDHIANLDAFVVKMEINVAFDENEYYSQYDYLDDAEYHGGTGLLGQPSLVYAVLVTRNSLTRYYLMNLVGRGHHSGKDGTLYDDLSGITTARHVVERVVVGVNF
jgi:hypothetical protein